MKKVAYIKLDRFENFFGNFPTKVSKLGADMFHFVVVLFRKMTSGIASVQEYAYCDSIIYFKRQNDFKKVRNLFMNKGRGSISLEEFLHKIYY